ncbi:hypothetical protein C440_10743 [Haloferax mucosum ATCC BAA-1512]|uniref:Uncharacterized protein n=1 Tax=Haloferax mucosum ATCC BAA-1512 TaxID=662479 RepID=M0IDG1_9EURY|nr:hypothetical protein C440_10743 [Haloferax mucosum ATCC BAA-1512]
MDISDPRVEESPWVKKVVEASSGGHPREMTISDCLSDYDDLREDLNALPAVHRAEDRLYYVRAEGQIVRVRAVFFTDDETGRPGRKAF